MLLELIKFCQVIDARTPDCRIPVLNGNFSSIKRPVTAFLHGNLAAGRSKSERNPFVDGDATGVIWTARQNTNASFRNTFRFIINERDREIFSVQLWYIELSICRVLFYHAKFPASIVIILKIGKLVLFSLKTDQRRWSNFSSAVTGIINRSNLQVDASVWLRDRRKDRDLTPWSRPARWPPRRAAPCRVTNDHDSHSSTRVHTINGDPWGSKIYRLRIREYMFDVIYRDGIRGKEEDSSVCLLEVLLFRIKHGATRNTAD